MLNFFESWHFFILLFYLCSHLFMFVHREKCLQNSSDLFEMKICKNLKYQKHAPSLRVLFAIPFKDLQSWIHLNFQVASLVSRSVNDSAVTTVEIIFNPSLKLIKRLLYVELILEITTVSIWMVKNQIFILHLYHKEPDQTKI